MSAAGFVASLQIFPGHRKPMVPLHEVRVLTNKGLEGDMHSLEESSQQVLLLGEETLDSLQRSPGEVKENIPIGNITLMTLSRNQLLAIGEVRQQRTSACNPCNRLEGLHHGLRAALEERRGMPAVSSARD